MCLIPHGRGGLRHTEAHGGDQAGAGEQQERSSGVAGRGHAGGGGSSERPGSSPRLITRLNPPPSERRPRCRRPLAARALSAGTGNP